MKRCFRVLVVFAVIITGIAATAPIYDNKYFEILKNIEIYTNLYKELNTYYVDELDPGRLMRTGIEAMVESLDPFTNYISESDIEGYRFRTEGQYHGIGALSEVMGDYLTITELYKDQPADKAGLKVGDQLIKVNGQDAKGKSPDEVNDILQGSPNTEVELTVRRPGEKNDKKIILVRGEVNVPNVPYYDVVDEKIAYVNLTTFTRDAGRNIGKALENLKKSHPDLEGVILDLRENGGGLLNEAVDICNLFLPKGELVVSMRGKVREWDRTFESENPPLDLDIPLAILINKGSASASEIVSGTIQDYDRGVLIGQRSYGKGLVQNTREVGYNSRLKLTTAKYYIPSGRCIQSVEYKNGEPVDIPDNKRTAFKTRNGRTVLDGGGIAPDVLLEKKELKPVVEALLKQHIIFDYVSEFCLKHDSIPAVESFKFEDFDQFVAFTNSRGFSYQTASEKLIQQLESSKDLTSGLISSDISSMKQKIVDSKKNELMDAKNDIIDLIEREIAGRYYYQRGKTQMSLRNDPELKEAIYLLKDKERYAEILKGNS